MPLPGDLADAAEAWPAFEASPVLDAGHFVIFLRLKYKPPRRRFLAGLAQLAAAGRCADDAAVKQLATRVRDDYEVAVDDGSCMELAVHTAYTSVRHLGPPWVDDAFLELVLDRPEPRERASAALRRASGSQSDADAAAEARVALEELVHEGPRPTRRRLSYWREWVVRSAMFAIGLGWYANLDDPSTALCGPRADRGERWYFAYADILANSPLPPLLAGVFECEAKSALGRVPGKDDAAKGAWLRSHLGWLRDHAAEMQRRSGVDLPVPPEVLIKYYQAGWFLPGKMQ